MDEDEEVLDIDDVDTGDEEEEDDDEEAVPDGFHEVDPLTGSAMTDEEEAL